MMTANDLLLRALLHELSTPGRDETLSTRARIEALEQSVLLLLKTNVERQEGRPIVEFPAPATDARGALHSLGPAKLPTRPQRVDTDHNGAPVPAADGDYMLASEVEPFLQVLADLVKERHHPYSRQALAVMERAKALLNPPE